MDARTRQYLFGLIFIGVAVYYLYRSDTLEFALYGCAGLAFLVNTLSAEARLVEYKRPLVIATWLLMGTAALLLLYLLQFKF